MGSDSGFSGVEGSALPRGQASQEDLSSPQFRTEAQAPLFLDLSESVDDLYIPPALQARYPSVLTTPIGRGGEATVWLVCEHDNPEARLALKVYEANLPFKEEVRERIRQVSGVPRYAPCVYDFGVERTGSGLRTGWEVLEYFPLGSLETLMTHAGIAGSLEHVGKALLKEIVDALAYWESEFGLRHLDLSPGNVLVRNDQPPFSFVLADLGGARVTSSGMHTTRTPLMAKAMYMAPEQLLGEHSDKTPYWSLGVILLQISLSSLRVGPYGRYLVDKSHRLALVQGVEPDVSMIGDPAWRRLLAGLLTKDSDVRWGEREVRYWLDNPSSEIPVHRRYERLKGYAFEGQSHFRVETLAEHMARAWEGSRKLVGGNLEELREWLRAGEVAPSLRAAIESCEDGRLDQDRLVANLIFQLNPALAPSFMGNDVDRRGLERLVRSAIADSDLVKLKLVERLFESRALLAYSHLDGCSDYAVLDAAWRAAYADLDSRLNRLALPGHVREALSPGLLDLAGILLLEIGYLQEQPTDESLDSDLATARKRGWFRRLESSLDQGSNDSARAWLLRTGANLAAREYRKICAEAERVMAMDRDPNTCYLAAVFVEQDVIDIWPERESAPERKLAETLPATDGLEAIVEIDGLIRCASSRLRELAVQAQALGDLRRREAEAILEETQQALADDAQLMPKRPDRLGGTLVGRLFTFLMAAAIPCAALYSIPKWNVYLDGKYSEGMDRGSLVLMGIFGNIVLVAIGALIIPALGILSDRVSDETRRAHNLEMYQYRQDLAHYKSLAKERAMAERERVAAIEAAERKKSVSVDYAALSNRIEELRNGLVGEAIRGPVERLAKAIES